MAAQKVVTEGEVPAWMHWPVIPVLYIQIELRIAQERGMDPHDLIREIGFDPATMTNFDPNAMVTPFAHAWLMNLIIHHTGNDGLGFELGLRLPAITHGAFGYALMSCSTFREAISVGERFWHLRERVARIHVSEQEDELVIDVGTAAVLPSKLRPVFFDCLMTVVHRGLVLSGDTHASSKIWLDYPEPDYYADYRDRVPSIRYDMPFIQIRLPTEILDRPLVMSNPITLQNALHLCQQESELSGYRPEEFLSQVRKHLVLVQNEYPTSEELAERLHISLRTLRRRLQLQGTGYKELLENARRQDAMRLLDNPALSIQRIAELLGYTNPINFTRAFRQWTGQTPTEYRTLGKTTLKTLGLGMLLMLHTFFTRMNQFLMDNPAIYEI